ncbi:hypothetical protein EDC01DRAFT_633533 [Geopyxis carbonaria]|nr:hypothetical protein EDC01DRAFT_633533 [Geopyxis carbonaria]
MSANSRLYVPPTSMITGYSEPSSSQGEYVYTVDNDGSIRVIFLRTDDDDTYEKQNITANSGNEAITAATTRLASEEASITIPAARVEDLVVTSIDEVLANAASSLSTGEVASAVAPRSPDSSDAETVDGSSQEVSDLSRTESPPPSSGSGSNSVPPAARTKSSLPTGINVETLTQMSKSPETQENYYAVVQKNVNRVIAAGIKMQAKFTAMGKAYRSHIRSASAPASISSFAGESSSYAEEPYITCSESSSPASSYKELPELSRTMPFFPAHDTGSDTTENEEDCEEIEIEVYT